MERTSSYMWSVPSATAIRVRPPRRWAATIVERAGVPPIAHEMVVVGDDLDVPVGPAVRGRTARHDLGELRAGEQRPAEDGEIGGAGPMTRRAEARRVPPGGVRATEAGGLRLHGREEAGSATLRVGTGECLGGVVG